jgi:PAS domain-containing protein
VPTSAPAVGSTIVLLLAGVVSQLLRRAANQQRPWSPVSSAIALREERVGQAGHQPEDGCIVDANPAAIRYYGYPRETLLACG